MLLGHCDARSLHVLGLSRWSTWTRPHRSRLTRTTWTPPACLTGLCAKPRPRCSAGPLASSAWWSDARTSTTTRRSSARPRRWGSSTCGWWTRWCAGRTAGSAPAVTSVVAPPSADAAKRAPKEEAEAASAVSRTARTGARRTSSSRVARRSSPRSASFQTASCVAALRADGRTIWATDLSQRAVPLTERALRARRARRWNVGGSRAAGDRVRHRVRGVHGDHLRGGGPARVPAPARVRGLAQPLRRRGARDARALPPVPGGGRRDDARRTRRATSQVVHPARGGACALRRRGEAAIVDRAAVGQERATRAVGRHARRAALRSRRPS